MKPKLFNNNAKPSCSTLMPHIQTALSAANRSSKVHLLPFGLTRHSPAQIFPNLFQKVVSNYLTHTGTPAIGLGGIYSCSRPLIVRSLFRLIKMPVVTV